MIQKTLEQIAEPDLDALIANAVPEGKTIEYKQDLPGGADADKKEFLADVSSFANTVGGDLVFGVTEARGLPTGLPGVAAADLDLELRRLDSMIASGLDPRIRYAAKTVDCGAAARVVILRVERSWNGPHRVIFKGHDKFYGRNSAGKYPLDVTELRSAFTMAASVGDRIRAFRADRIIALSNNDTPIPLTPEAKVILHCVPLESFSGKPLYDLVPFFNNPAKLRPIYSSGWGSRFNLDGVVSYSGHEPAFSYTQLYRNGIIEAVTGALLHHEHKGRIVIPSIAYEREILSYFPEMFRVLRELGAPAPVAIGLTLTGVKGFEMGVDSMGWEHSHKITSDTLILPETIVEDLNIPAATILKPLFDMIWNACGYPSSKNFDQNGQWVNRR